MLCAICSLPLPARSRSDRQFCSRVCAARKQTLDRRSSGTAKRHNYIYRLQCEICGNSFVGKKSQRFCTRSCQVRNNNRARAKGSDLVRYRPPRVWLGTEKRSAQVWTQGACSECGSQFVSQGSNGRYCSQKCSSNAAWRRKTLRQGEFSPTPRTRFSIYERDGWMCHLCGDSVEKGLHYLDPWSATLDHLIPQSVAVDHSPENLRLAHRRCNSLRGARPLETLIPEMG